ncbi:MAG: hypothetical protein ACRDGQ_08615 [Candidatus Limnocylindrales bacterium]
MAGLYELLTLGAAGTVVLLLGWAAQTLGSDSRPGFDERKGAFLEHHD